jgi:hypothetical protein
MALVSTSMSGAPRKEHGLAERAARS